MRTSFGATTSKVTQACHQKIAARGRGPTQGKKIETLIDWRQSRHIPDRLDLEPAVERRAAGLHARAGRQHCRVLEVAAIDAVEFLLLALVLEPDDDLEKAVHVRARSFDELL